MENEKTPIEKLNDFLEEEHKKPRQPYQFYVGPKAQKLIDDTLRELYGDKLIKPKELTQ